MTQHLGPRLARKSVHLFWLLDTSGSMGAAGKMKALNAAMRDAVSALASAVADNPRVELLVRVVTFDNDARWHVAEPVPIGEFEWRDIVETPEGRTEIGRAVNLVTGQIRELTAENQVIPPALVLVSDGKPTDLKQPTLGGALRALTEEPWGKKASRVAIGIGADADMHALGQFIGHDEIRPIRASNATELARSLRWASTVVIAELSRTGDHWDERAAAADPEAGGVPAAIGETVAEPAPDVGPEPPAGPPADLPTPSEESLRVEDLTSPLEGRADPAPDHPPPSPPPISDSMAPRDEGLGVQWSPLWGTATGSAHRRRNQPCEDAAGALVAAPWAAVAVADGHGSSRHPSAARGAALAVKAATEVLIELPDGRLADVLTALGRVPERLQRRWHEHVLADVAQTPLTEEGRETAGEDDVGALIAHGTTVLGAAASARWIAIVQLGDGDVLTGRANTTSAGRPIRPVVSDDPRVTDSLCHRDAARRARVALIDRSASPVDVVMLSTDGFGSAFEQPDWHDETIRQLRATAHELDDIALASAVRRWCDAPARVSGDDVAIGLLVAREPSHSMWPAMHEGREETR